MAINYPRLTTEGNNFLQVMARELGCPDDPVKAGRLVTAVLHVLRSQLTTDQVANLIAQVPMPLKIILVKEWQPANVWPQSRSLDDFLTEIKFYHPRTTSTDFPTVDSIENTVVVVFRHLGTILPKRNLQLLIQNLPPQFVPLLDNLQRA